MSSSTSRYPAQIPYIIGNEACERFSFYGMRNVLTAFLISSLLATQYGDSATLQEEAKKVFHFFAMGVYFFPLLGGYLSDRYWGKYKTIFILSIVYTLGQACLVFWSDDRTGFFAGLALIALGSGGIKPCVSAFIGDQFDESNKHLSRNIFGLFYWIINFGSFFASLITPLLLKDFGPKVAFGVPGVLMAISTIVLWLGRHRFVHVPPEPNGMTSQFWKILPQLALGQLRRNRNLASQLEDRYGTATMSAIRQALAIMPLFLLVSVFWAIFDQKASTVVIQGKAMARDFFGYQIQESQMQALNPLFVMLLIPLMNRVVYPALERRGRRLRMVTRMQIGIALSGVAFAVVALLQWQLDGGSVLHIAWQIIPYVILTLAEVLVSTTGLEFAYSQAPLSMKGVIMSLWNLTITLGNFMVVLVTAVHFGGAAQILFFAVLAGIAALAFGRVARGYVEVENYRQAA